MKLLVLTTMLVSNIAFAEVIPMHCGDPEEQDVYGVEFNIKNETVTLAKNGKTLCENTSYAYEGEIFDYGSGEAIFYCNDIGYEYDNRYDETVLYVDGSRDEMGWQNEYFCYDQ